MLAAEIRHFLASGDTQRLWLQSATTAVQLALAEVLRQRGLEPAATAGIGMGELAAAVAAGRTTVGDATRVARAVSVLFAAAAGEGRSVTVATIARAWRACSASTDRRSRSPWRRGYR